MQKSRRRKKKQQTTTQNKEPKTKTTPCMTEKQRLPNYLTQAKAATKVFTKGHSPKPLPEAVAQYPLKNKQTKLQIPYRKQTARKHSLPPTYLSAFQPLTLTQAAPQHLNVMLIQAQRPFTASPNNAPQDHGMTGWSQPGVLSRDSQVAASIARNLLPS